jgi:hypothetical protein
MKKFLIYLIIPVFSLLTACSAKNEPIIVKFKGTTSEKKWAIKELNPELPFDWSSFGFLTFEMKSSTTQRFELRLIDSAGLRRLTIQPVQGAWVRASIPLIHFQTRNTKGMDMAAIGKTARPGYWIGFSAAVGTIKHVDSLVVLMRQPIDSQYLELRNVQLTMAAMDTVFGPYPLVDEFGQWIPAEWPGKAKTIEDLKTAWDQEDKTLQSGDLGVSKYGGFLGTKARATGFFHIEKIDGKWWFVDPEGYLFFSTGSCGIGPRSELSRIQGREYIFDTLPPAGLTAMNQRPGNQVNQPATAPAGQQTGAQQTQTTATPNQPARRGGSSFYTWNLTRRYGMDWSPKWIDMTVRRMQSWGINTVGNWSDGSLGNSHRITYVATVSGWGIETGVMGLPDIYGADYASRVDAAAKRQCATRKDDPYLLGYFIGNEQPWPGRETELVKTILEGGETPMQLELKKYLAAGDTPERRKEFAYATFTKFISTVYKAIKKYDPNHLNLGIRYGGSPPDDIIKASKGNFDVFSMNVYGYSINQNTMNKIYDLTGLPIIIGEFHFGTPGRGLAPGLAQVRNQEERGVAYRYYVENAATHPALIGTHWFQWVDQPSTGRNDGENYNIGFVDATDRPYTELNNAAKETFKRLLDVHSGKIPPVSRQAMRQ